MMPRTLVAGIGNIFNGDDGFGVRVAQELLAGPTLHDVRVIDTGIRGIDLAFALLDPYDLVILIDASQRGGLPGTLYTLRISPEDIEEMSDQGALVNSHGLDPVRVLALAKSMGAHVGNILLVACEPQILDCTDTGHIGLSPVVEASISPALDLVRNLILDSVQLPQALAS